MMHNAATCDGAFLIEIGMECTSKRDKSGSRERRREREVWFKGEDRGKEKGEQKGQRTPLKLHYYRVTHNNTSIVVDRFR